MKKSKEKSRTKAHYLHVLQICAAFAAAGAVMFIMIFLLQSIWAHRQSEYNLQNIECSPVLGRITMEDRIIENMYQIGTAENSADASETLRNLQPGDILVTLSTHTLGYRHGHAAIVTDEDTTLESTVIGTESQFCPVSAWRTYSDYAVLRVKGATPELQKEVALYACENLHNIPYNLTAGIFGKKVQDDESRYFSVQCAYLVWYAWEHFGYDLDSDGGRIVTPADLLESDLVEVVESRGLD